MESDSSELDMLPPVDHYSFYKNRSDPMNPTESLLNDQNIEIYRDLGIIDTFEKVLHFGEKKEGTGCKNELRIWGQDFFLGA